MNKARTPTQIEIRSIESGSGYCSRVEAVMTWSFGGTPVSIVEERSAHAVGHRLVADALEATPPWEKWNLSTEVVTSYRDVTKVKLAIELNNGDLDETARARALLHQVLAPLLQAGKSTERD